MNNVIDTCWKNLKYYPASSGVNASTLNELTRCVFNLFMKKLPHVTFKAVSYPLFVVGDDEKCVSSWTLSTSLSSTFEDKVKRLTEQIVSTIEPNGMRAKECYFYLILQHWGHAFCGSDITLFCTRLHVVRDT